MSRQKVRWYEGKWAKTTDNRNRPIGTSNTGVIKLKIYIFTMFKEIHDKIENFKRKLETKYFSFDKLSQ